MKHLQPALFNLSSPPVKPVKVLPVLDEPAFYEALFEHPPSRVSQCSQCKGAYFSISYHLLYKCSAEVQPTLQTLTPSIAPGGRIEAPKVETSPVPLIDTPIKDPPENMSGVYERDNDSNKLSEHYPYKSKGMPDAEAMHPSKWVAPQPPAPKEERPPHWWHWVRAAPPREVVGLDGKSYQVTRKIQEPFTPSLTARRRSIPSIACGLYAAVWVAALSYGSLQSAAPEYYKPCKVAHDSDKGKIEKHIKLLVFCDLDNERVRHVARGWWSVVLADGRLPQWRLVAEKQLRLLGYELADKEPDGSFESAGACAAWFLEGEGVKGR